MLDRVWILFVAFALASCQTAIVDVRHVKTDKGYLNSRLVDLGYLFVWNKDTGYIAQLAQIDLRTRTANDSYSDLSAKEITGFEVGGNVDATARAAIDAEVKSAASLTLKNARVVAFSDTFSDLSAEINRRIAAGQNIRETWFLDEASKARSPLRYLLVYRSIKADETNVYFDDNKAAKGVLTVPTGWGGNIKVAVTGFGSADFKGAAVTTLVDYYIIKAYIGQNSDGTPTYNFIVDDAIPADFALSSVLRHL